MLALSGAVSSQSRIDGLVRPVMAEMVVETGQNTHLAVLDDTEVVFIAVDQPTTAVSLNITVGTREPAAVTALGKSFIRLHARPGTKSRFIQDRIQKIHAQNP